MIFGVSSTSSGSTFTSGSAVAAGSAFAPPAGPSAPVPLATVGVSASAAGFSTGSASGGHMSGLPAFIQAYRSVVFLKGLLFPPGRLGSTVVVSVVPVAASLRL